MQLRTKKDGRHYPVGERSTSTNQFNHLRTQDAHRLRMIKETQQEKAMVDIVRRESQQFLKENRKQIEQALSHLSKAELDELKLDTENDLLSITKKGSQMSNDDLKKVASLGVALELIEGMRNP